MFIFRFITLNGFRHKVTKKIALKNEKEDPFEKGKTDVFKLTNVDYVGPIQKVLIEHDNSGKAPGCMIQDFLTFNVFLKFFKLINNADSKV